MLHIEHAQSNSIRYFLSSQFGGFLVHCLNGLCILLSNDLALHLQSGHQCVGEGAEVFRKDCKFLGEKERRGEGRGRDRRGVLNNHEPHIRHLLPSNGEQLRKTLTNCLHMTMHISLCGVYTFGIFQSLISLLNSQLLDTVT